MSLYHPGLRALRRPLALALALAPTLSACHDARASAETAIATEGSSPAKQEPAERCPVKPRALGTEPQLAANDSAAWDSTAKTAVDMAPRGADLTRGIPAESLAARADSGAPGGGATAAAGSSAAGKAASGTAAKPAPVKKLTRTDSVRLALRAKWSRVDSLPRLAGSIFPGCRVVAFYGNPLSKRMGVLGEYPKDEMLAKLDGEVKRWQQADTTVKVIPALHLIVTVAQGSAGRDGKWRMRMPDTLVDRMAEWAQTRDALLFLDVQVGQSTLREELPRLVPFLKRPNVHLGIDPEFSMKDGTPPGKKIGTYDAADVNYAIDLLASVVKENDLPPKVLVVHRFTRKMLTNASHIRVDPRVQVVVDMDGWGGKQLKLDSYRAYVASEPVQFTGFKLFYHNDQKKPGTKMMTPEEVIASLEPKPMYIQYQ